MNIKKNLIKIKSRLKSVLENNDSIEYKTRLQEQEINKILASLESIEININNKETYEDNKLHEKLPV